MPTIKLPYDGTNYNANTSTDIQTALVQEILSAINAAPPANTYAQQGQFSNGAVGLNLTLSTLYYYDVQGDSANAITGAANVPSAQLILSQGGDRYNTGGTAVSTVVVTDQSVGPASTIINSNLVGALLAVTGATANGPSNGNTLEGLAGANQFITGNGGRDAVLLDGAANSLTSNGNDVVLVGGPSTITASAGGMDNVTQSAGTVLAFINQSNAGTLNSVTGAAGGIVLMAGAGSASVTAGTGQEYFFLDTSAGNTTINANNSAAAALTFVKDANVGTANIQVNNFASSGIVAVNGYSNFSVAQSPSNTGGSVLSLSDGSQISFNNLSTTALQAAIRTV